MLRERAGARELTLSLPDGARVSDALAALRDVAPPELPLVMAVNREYARDDRVLDPGDELALIPPVSGGSGVSEGGTLVWARVTSDPLSLDVLARRVVDRRAGDVPGRHPGRGVARVRGLRRDGRGEDRLDRRRRRRGARAV